MLFTVELLSLSVVMTLFSSTFAQPSEESYVRYRVPPPRENLIQDRRCVGGLHMNDSSFNCHDAIFIASNGHFQPCNRHNHCYPLREPTDWCILAPHYRWTNWGCHCDRKLGTCLIERFDYRNRQLQWAYCNLKKEFYCATRMEAYREGALRLPGK